MNALRLLLGIAALVAGWTLRTSTEPLVASASRESTTISEQALRAHVEYLADDARLGRDTGSPGELASARYIASRLKEAGVAPGGDVEQEPYLRTVELERMRVDALPELSLTDVQGERALAVYREDFDVRFNVPTTAPLRVVVVDVKEAEPLEPDAEVAVVLSGSSGRARRWLEASGAADGAGWGLVVRSGSRPRSSRAPRLPSSLRRPDRERTGGNWLRAYDELFERLTAGEIETLQLRAHVTRETVRAVNVVGMLQGVGTPENPELARETVVLSAHYDHIGAPGRDEHGHSSEGASETAAEGEEEDLIYNGADDNASGTAAVIELAAALAEGPPPVRTVVFLLATGEEKGLLGTLAYLDDPTVPLADTIFNLNIEMIGRPDPEVGGPGRLWMVGWDETDLGPALAQRGLAIVADPRPEQRFFQRSDNIAFVQRGIVGQSLSSYCLHDDYHRVSDEIDTLDFAHLTAGTKEALRALRLIVDGTLTPAWAADSRFRPR